MADMATASLERDELANENYYQYPAHDDEFRHYSPDVPTRQEQCFEGIGGRIRKADWHPPLGETISRNHKAKHHGPRDANINGYEKESTAQRINPVEYQTSVLKLACSYQPVIEKYAHIERAALNYRASAVGPSRILQDHLTGPQALQCITRQPNAIIHRLSLKVFLGGVPMIGKQVTTVVRDQLQRGLEMFGCVTLKWPKGTTVQSSTCFYYPYGSQFKVKRGHCYATFKDSNSVALLLATCQRRNKGFYMNLTTVCPELKLSQLESIQIIPWDRTDSEMHATHRGVSRIVLLPVPIFSPILYRESIDLITDSPARGKKLYSVFVGALHGMITARALFTMFEELFANVESVVLDTDRFHYPIGK
ncbi:unnamed protein product [Echinostoma caproni]|uniref:RRM domain-containing protein n=1 Tax=Echinostoma caproni TaxID=27848 RepID=A0A183AH80_9TREM|nr:unnamed protein product [Echinostoma caproni]